MRQILRLEIGSDGVMAEMDSRSASKVDGMEPCSSVILRDDLSLVQVGMAGGHSSASGCINN